MAQLATMHLRTIMTIFVAGRVGNHLHRLYRDRDRDVSLISLELYKITHVM